MVREWDHKISHPLTLGDFLVEDVQGDAQEDFCKGSLGRFPEILILD